jgi:hypothetical protein
LGIYDRWEIRKIGEMVDKVRPDFVVVTGDLFGHRKAPVVRKILKYFDQVVGRRCPWTFAWGNHDQEIFEPASWWENFDHIESCLAVLPHCLYVQSRELVELLPGASWLNDERERQAAFGNDGGETFNQQTDVFYGGNFVIQVRNQHELVWNLLILNSRRNFGIPPKVLGWLESMLSSQQHQIPTIAFFHVPTREYDDLFHDDSVMGYKKERVCFELDDGRTHATLKRLPSFRACFVGHDHVNDYGGTIEGIEYVYGRKTGTHGYGGLWKTPAEHTRRVRIGGKLITLKLDAQNSDDGTLTHHTVFYDGTEWVPTKILR